MKDSDLALFAPQGREYQAGTIPVTALKLQNEGFDNCVLNGKPCKNAGAIHPHQDPEAVTLCCMFHKRVVSAGEAEDCTHQK